MNRLLVICAIGMLFAGTALASSVWSGSGYQWHARAPLTVRMADRTSGEWPARIARAASEWSAASAVDVVLGNSGKVEIRLSQGDPGYCAWTSFDLQGGYAKHATVWLSVPCLAGRSDAFKQFAVCNEIGHALGLPDYRLDTPAVPSCMAPSNWGPSPNQDDFAYLWVLYG